MSLLALGAIAAGASLLGQGMANSSNSRAVDAQNKANMELAQFQHMKNVEMWNMENEYNLPANQMARLKSAGLNPNMVYGSGSAATVAGQAPQYKAPNIQAYTGMKNPIGDAASTYLSYAMSDSQIKNMHAQNENLKTQNDAMNQQIVTEGLKQSEIAARTARSQYDLSLAKKLESTSLEAAISNVRKIQSETSFIDSNIALNEFKKDLTAGQLDELKMRVLKLKQDYDFDSFEQGMKRMGIYPGDKLYERILARFLKGEYGTSSVANSVFEKIPPLKSIPYDTIGKGYIVGGRVINNKTRF